MQAMSATVEQLVGQTFADFSIDQLLGQGTLSAVYLAHQSTSGQRALLTAFLLPGWCEDQSRLLFMERFSRLASILVSLDHPHILPTYAFGEQCGYPYLVTGLLEEVSLAGVLKRQTRCTPVLTLALLKQIADALDYAHDHGMVHGTLKPANILVDGNQTIHLTGLGLAHILEMRGIATTSQPLPHLYSIAGTLLYSPEYLAPEIVQGRPADTQSDMYALGIILYELLCGKPPFTGDDPIAVAMQHVQRPIPTLRSGYAQAPAALDLIIQRALDRDPDRRYRSASKLASTFERVLNVLDAAASSAPVKRDPSSRLDFSERPTLPWFEADAPSTIQWQPQTPGINASQLSAPGMRSVMPPAVPWKSVRSTMEEAAQQDHTSVIHVPPQAAEENSPVKPASGQAGPAAQLLANGSLPLNAYPTNVPEFGQGITPGTFQPKDEGEKPAQKRSVSHGRRRVLLATGGVVAAGLLTFGGIDLAHMLIANKDGKQNLASSQTGAAKSTGTTKAGTKSPAAKKAATAGTKNAGSANAATKNTANAGTTGGGAKDMGMVVGASSQAIDTAKSFTNPADGRSSLLIHLPNNTFVAYESACTHQGVTVNYNPMTHTLICPLHGSVFDPTNGGAVLNGPAVKPLPKVSIMVHADGTITTG